MTTKVREYRTKVPFTIHDWRRGQRYVLAKYPNSEVKIIVVKQRKEDGNVITECHKELDLSKSLPTVVKKIMKEGALTVDEYSTNVDVLASADVKSEERQQMEDLSKAVDEMVVGDSGHEQPDGDHGELLDSSEVDARVVASTSETKYINRHYDVNTFSVTVKTVVRNGEESGVFGAEKVKTYSYDLCDGEEAGCCVYKLVDVRVNSMLFGWIADMVKNSIRDLLVKFNEKVVATREEWIDMKEEELVGLEQAMVKKQLKKL